jgi:hypothetical protein
LVDGIIRPSVTQVLNYKFPNKYQFVNREVLQNAADRGTAIHKAIEDYEVLGKDDNSRALQNYKFLKKNYEFEVFSNEQILVIESYYGNIVCGRFDMMITKLGNELDNKKGLGLVDVKTTSTLDKEYLFYQLNLYRLGAIQAGLDVDFLGALHIRDDKRKYINIPIDEKSAYSLIDEYYREVKK